MVNIVVDTCKVIRIHKLGDLNVLYIIYKTF
jgi:hypothetical protein